MSTYRHRQIAWPTVVAFAATLATQSGASARNLRRGRRLRALASLPWAASLVLSTGMFSWLDTEVTGEEFVASFVAGALRRRIPLDEIESAEVVTVPWYCGWGARMTPRGWLSRGSHGRLYNVWGRHAVALRLREGKSFTVGSDEPEALLAAIEAARTVSRAA